MAEILRSTGTASSPPLAAAEALSQSEALNLGSKLLAEGNAKAALPYLRRGQTEPPTAFGLTRLAQACRDLAKPQVAATLYEQALDLEPSNGYALVGRAHALADFGAPLARLQTAVQALVPLTDDDPLWVVDALIDILRTAEVTHPHTAISHSLREVRVIARELRAPSSGVPLHLRVRLQLALDLDRPRF